MSDWREQHFNVPEIIRLRPEPEPEGSGAGFVWLLLAVLALPVGGVAIANHRYSVDVRPAEGPQPHQATSPQPQHVRANQPTFPVIKPIPAANITFHATLAPPAMEATPIPISERHAPESVLSSPITGHASTSDPTPSLAITHNPTSIVAEAPSGAAPAHGLTQVRAQDLQRLITSREAGIDLMTRDRAIALNKLTRAEFDLDTARRRLTDLENQPPPRNDSGAAYQWNLAYSDTLAALKNATTLITAQQKVTASFNRRIEQAMSERDAAREELAGAGVR